MPTRLPVVFVAHGSPLLALDEAQGHELAAWAASLPRPEAILVVSAHWQTARPAVGPLADVPVLHDFAGFPAALDSLDYRAPHSRELATRVADLLGGVERHPRRGLDHGAWLPLRWMFPRADVPVLQLSLWAARPATLLAVGRSLAPLRDEGVLVAGSGALTHNLAALDLRPGPPVPRWAREFDDWVAGALARGDSDALLRYAQAPGAERAHPTPEHFEPLLVAAGAAGEDLARVRFPVTGFELGGLSRRCVQLG